MIREDRFNIILFLGIVSMNLRYPKTLKPVSALDGPDRRAQLKGPEHVLHISIIYPSDLITNNNLFSVHSGVMVNTDS